MATVEIDGITLEAENGKMIIEVADEAGIDIPRFCYHKKLSVAANCRMCLVEVENSRKPVPACATPITNGMKVFTKSEQAKYSQKAVMEFLLINHPLDCPICDQGGECELQDVSMGYGTDSSNYIDTKRSVEDNNLGTLISTEMTRCIHCTRCVRFGKEIAGIRELGATGRGEHMQIGTYVEHSMTSEVSGNIIDLCPVGALTAKPSRYNARAWELTEHPSVSPHDCLGTNINVHVRRDEVIRVVPRENDLINETWIADRDRFSYIGINSKSRALQPRIKKDGVWQEVEWETALKFAADGILKTISVHGANQVAGLASSSSTLEELYLFQRVLRGLGVANIDYRLQQSDFSDQDNFYHSSQNTAKIVDIEQSASILLVGTNPLREVPLSGLRIRKAAQNGATICALNPATFNLNTDYHQEIVTSTTDMALNLASILSALESKKTPYSAEIKQLTIGLSPTKIHKEIAEQLLKENSLVITGHIFENHPEASILRILMHALIERTGAKLLHLSQGGNSLGASIAGVLPHREPGGKAAKESGLNVQQTLQAKLKSYVLMNVDPAHDFNNPSLARESLMASEFVIALITHENKSLEDYANVILPMAAFTETSGTYVNIDNVYQSVAGVTSPKGLARPGWKILRVLGNLLKICGFEYNSSNEVLDEIKHINASHTNKPYQPKYPESLPSIKHALTRLGEWSIYGQDVTLRYSTDLQKSGSADKANIKVHSNTAKKYNLTETATVSQGNIEITLPLVIDDCLAEDVVWVANALPETSDLGAAFGEISIK